MSQSRALPSNSGLHMAVKMLGRGLQWFSRQCSTRLFSGSALVFLVTASALAGTEPTQPTASGPADAAVAINTKCTTEVVKDQPIAASQSIPASGSTGAALTTAVADLADDPQPPKTEMLQDKLWSTNLGRSSSNNVPKAPQCGIIPTVPPPAN